MLCGENLHLGAALLHHTGLRVVNERYNWASGASAVPPGKWWEFPRRDLRAS
jgi:hypothetical protein